MADTNASLHGLIGVLSAVILRERTGLGQHIDIAMVDATLVTDDQFHYEAEDSEATMGLPADIWETGAGPILVSSDFRLLWRLMTTHLGVVDPTTSNMDFETKVATRRKVALDYFAALSDWAQVEAAMDRMNTAWGQVRVGAALSDQPTLKHRGSIAQIDDRAGGTRPVPQSPYRFSDALSGVRGPAPHLGEHNRQVLSEWLGMPAQAVDKLIADHVLANAVAD